MNDWYNKAVELLARREHSCLELKNKLKQRGAPQELLDELFLQLKINNYQSDERFAASYTRMRTEAGFGPLRIRAELQQRGISSELIAQVLDQDDEIWLLRLRELWQRRFRGKFPQNQQEYGRQVRFFLQRGFIASWVGRIIKIKG